MQRSSTNIRYRDRFPRHKYGILERLNKDWEEALEEIQDRTESTTKEDQA